MPFNFNAVAASLSGNASPRESKTLIGGVISGGMFVGGGAIAAFAGANPSAAAYTVMGGLGITAGTTVAVGLWRIGKALYDGCVPGRPFLDDLERGPSHGEQSPLLSSFQDRVHSQPIQRYSPPLSPRQVPLPLSRDVSQPPVLRLPEPAGQGPAQVLNERDILRWNARVQGELQGPPLSPGAVSLPSPRSWQDSFPTAPPSWPGSVSRSTDPAAVLREGLGFQPLRGPMRRGPLDNASFTTLLSSEQASPRQIPLPPSRSDQPTQEGSATRRLATSLERARITDRPLRTGGRSRSV